MLFDLQGPRKTAVKVIYLGLAILMAGGLVLFGVGSSVNGGLADVFTKGSGSGDLQKQVTTAQTKVNANPKDPKAYQALIAAQIALAGSSGYYVQKSASQQPFTTKGQAELKQVTKSWLAYSKLTGKPDLTTASYAVSAYQYLNDAKGAQQAQAIVAQYQPNAANYLALMQYALYSGDTFAATGAEIKARQLATPAQKAQVAQQIKAAKKQVAQRSADIQKQIQAQFAAQQKSGSGAAPGNPFAGAGGAATGGTVVSSGK